MPMADSLPPPTYSQEDPGAIGQNIREPQIQILPTVDAINFQSGYLGAEGERAAIEGEIQIKDIEHAQWSKLALTLRTYEAAYNHDIELDCKEFTLHTHHSRGSFPSTFPFSIPLPPDTPQSVQTPHSSLAHTLTASLHPVDPQSPILSRRIRVYTRRYTSHTLSLPVAPEIHSLSDPARMQVQVPRTSFKVGEPIPVYVMVPPPSKEIVIDKGLRLRNARVDLVRVVKVKREIVDERDTDSDSSFSTANGVDEDHAESSNSDAEMSLLAHPPSNSFPFSPLLTCSSSSHKTVVARSGATCRFHTSRSIKLRFLLRPSFATTSPTVTHSSLPSSDHQETGLSDGDTPSISQTTLLHSITFHLHVQISFLDIKQQSEKTSTLRIPITMLPPAARLPEISQTFDEAYSKKHDRPPVQTNRYDDNEWEVPHYSEGEAGPSMSSNGAPPPFEERDAPPPFFSSAAEASTSSRLPTFLESEREILIPDSSYDSVDLPDVLSVIEGEGIRFGFHAVDQFDGHSEDMRRSMTPPPTMEMAAGDTDLTALTEIRESSQGLTLVFDQSEDNMISEEQPPPPPPMDDPSDPPPSIDDSTFRRPGGFEHISPSQSPPLSIPVYDEEQNILSPPRISSSTGPTTPGHAPPPYLIPDVHHDQESVSRPPPYVD